MHRTARTARGAGGDLPRGLSPWWPIPHSSFHLQHAAWETTLGRSAGAPPHDGHVSSLLPFLRAVILFLGLKPLASVPDEEQLTFASVNALCGQRSHLATQCEEHLHYILKVPGDVNPTLGAQTLETKSNQQNYIPQHPLLLGCRHVIQSPPIRCPSAGLWFKEQLQKESHGALLPGHRGHSPVAGDHVIPRLAAVVPTSQCSRDSGLPGKAWGLSNFLAVVGTADSWHLLHLVILQWPEDLFLECSLLPASLHGHPSICPLN